MIKQKAPRDMTFPEGIAELKKRYIGHTFSWEEIDAILAEPAPNPFTPDQLAVMREFQRDGLNYAARDKNGFAHVFYDKPCKTSTHWDSERDYFEEVVNFISEAASWEDAEPLCFADYAPLNNEITVS